jgi:hypothetical protein
MLSTETYQKLYILEEDPSPALSNMGKTIIDLHSEFGAQKVAGKAAICEAQASYGNIFHQDKELVAVIAQCLSRVLKDVNYSPFMEEVPDWIANMPLDEQIGDAHSGLNAVAEADQAIGDWKVLKRGPLTLHTMMQGGPVNLGWTSSNRFDPIADVPDASVPSNVTNNV